MSNNTRRIVACAICKSRTVFKCSRCKRVFYCSKTHQIEHWKHHKLVCQPKFFQRTITCLGPKDCFVDASRVTKEELVVFISSSLSKVGLCVLDNYLNDDIAKRVFFESQTICGGNSFNNFGETLIIKYLSKNTSLYPTIFNLQLSFNNLVDLASQDMKNNKILDKGLYVQHICRSARYNLKSDIFYENAFEKSLFNESVISCSYYSTHNYNRLNGGLSRYYIQNNKIVDIEPMFNRLVVFLANGKVIKKCSPSNIDLLIISALYKIS
ncbi:uncharacterized protein LOC136073894 isoform X2 [Hydra vulgaris]|uniref:Uncharacterized protein LOC136073894 isoform X2 n=1 Tax=Hydra vulgaris TaxID=6087 RepID=A0ABM4DMH3_HYDVU